MQDADRRPVPEVRQVEPDILQHVHGHRQAVPVREEGLQEGLVGAAPEGARRVEAGEHRGEGRLRRAGDEDAGVQAAEVGEALVDVGGGGELRVVEEPVDVPQHERVGIDEDAGFVVGQLPEPQLAEIVERGVEAGLAALGEGRLGMQPVAGVAVRRRPARSAAARFRHQPDAEGSERRQLCAAEAPPVCMATISASLPVSLMRADERLGAHDVVAIGDERDEGPPGAGRGLGLGTVARGHGRQETDFRRLPSGSRLIALPISFVQADTAGTRERSMR